MGGSSIRLAIPASRGIGAGAMVKVDGDRQWLRSPPPLLGEHTRELCAEAGYSDQEIQELYGDPADTVRRHARLLGLIEAGDKPAIFEELDNHGDRSFIERLETLLGESSAPVRPVG